MTYTSSTPVISVTPVTLSVGTGSGPPDNTPDQLFDSMFTGATAVQFVPVGDGSMTVPIQINTNAATGQYSIHYSTYYSLSYILIVLNY